ncbi:MAG TPA: ATP-binding protein [Thermoanaerobaculia bacterium]|jgi:signal transduction histidine kinase/CheY-like chemotaxis protein
MRESRPLLLLLDDDPDDRTLARIVLERELPRLQVEEITDAPSFAQACGRRSFDVVVLECRLQWADGMALLSVLTEDWPEVPVILFTRQGSEEVCLRAVRLGASDYLVKSPGGFLRLPLAVRSALDKVRTRASAGAVPLQSLVEQARVAVFSTTPEGRLLNASPAFLRILGAASFEEAARLDLRPLAFALAGPGVPPPNPGAPDVRPAKEVRLRRADGSPIWVEVVGALARGPEGSRVDGLIEDVTARKAAEEESARQSSQLRDLNEDLQQFASITAHELQEPVRMMERNAMLLQEDFAGKLGEGGDELVDAVVDAARRLRALIEDLLSLSRLESRGLRRERIGADELLDRALANLETAVEESGAKITRSPLPVIEADPSQMVQVFQNLLANAIKFHGPKPPRVQVSASRGAHEWTFSVRDNGIGIDPAEAEAIFSMFTRLHPDIPGSGIGLALCRKIVERHGGRIWVESAPDRGSTFSFTLPEAIDSEA